MKSVFSIKDLENLTGIKAHTLRIWEKRYNILEPKRSETNIRYYELQDLKKILNINLLYEEGYKISKIADLQDEQIVSIASEILNVDEKSPIKEVDILLKGIIDLDTTSIENTLQELYLEKGVARLYIEVISPLLVRIGELWQLNTINISHEHLFTNVLRQFIIVKTDEIVPEKLNDKSVLIFLGQDEHHEIPILFYHHLLKGYGWDCIYLGTNVPTKDLKLAFIQKSPDMALTSMISYVDTDQFSKRLNELLEFIPKEKLNLSGSNAISNEALINKGVFLIKNFEDFNQIFKTVK